MRTILLGFASRDFSGPAIIISGPDSPVSQHQKMMAQIKSETAVPDGIHSAILLDGREADKWIDIREKKAAAAKAALANAQPSVAKVESKTAKPEGNKSKFFKH
jgi:hypothetical protein